MSVVAPGLRTSGGATLVLGELLGRGGEARVYALADDPGRAAKIYARPDPERARKLKAMLAKVPVDPDRKGGHVSIAWPEALALDAGGEVVGFVMPRIDARRYLPLHQLYHPRSRRSRAPGISWRYLVRIARNLSATLAALHEAGYVVGDLNESNILVDDRALVTLVDLDSIQVSSGTRVFRCNVGKAEYTPPELQGRSFRETTRRVGSDRFGLAVLTFLLLMEGNHPFTGVYAGEGEPPGMEANIASKRSPYFGSRYLEPPPAAPPLALLGPELGSLLRRAMLGPAWRRPDPRALQQSLENLEAELETCHRRVSHAYRQGLERCPWCARAELLGSEAYPLPGAARPPVSAQLPRASAPAAQRSSAASPAQGQASSPPAGRGAGAEAGGRAPAAAGAGAAAATKAGSGARARPRRPGTTRAPRGFRGSWLLFHSRLPLLSLLLVALLGAPAVLLAGELRRSLEPSGGIELAALLALVAVPPLGGAAWLYLLARRHAALVRSLIALERVLRAALGASLLSLVASLGVGLTLGRGSVLAGDWLLLPSFWIVAFVLLLRAVGPGRP